MKDWLQELRFAGRRLLAEPGFAFVAVLTLAVGIGANTAIYSLVQAILLRPLPFSEPDRLVRIWETAQREQLELRSLSMPMLRDVRGLDGVFDEVAGRVRLSLSLTGEGVPERVAAEVVSPAYFDILGFSPVMGRLLAAEDDGLGVTVPNIVLSESLWRRRFGADPATVGKTLRLDEVSVTVVGVARGEGLAGAADLWLPLNAIASVRPRAGRYFENRGSRWLGTVARLAPGVTLEQAQRRMDVEAESTRLAHPDVMRNRGITVVSLEEQLFGDAQLTTLILMSAVGLVMLIVCANLANLLLARTVSRGNEMALRSAIGATQARLMRQLLTEAFLLALLGAGLGVLCALWTQDLLASLSLFEQLPAYVTLGVDWQTLVFVLLLCVGTTLMFGTLPALVASRSELARVAGTPRGTSNSFVSARVRGSLVAAQVALALLLAAGSGLMFRSLYNQMRIDPGFRAEGLITVAIQLPVREYDGRESARFAQQLVERVGAHAWAEDVAVASEVPLIDGYSAESLRVEERLIEDPEHRLRTYHHEVTPGFFSTMGIGLLSGRDFAWTDVEDAPLVAIVSEKMARVGWPGESPIGKRVSADGADGPWRTVVGVVRDVHYRDLVNDPVANPEDPDVYYPMLQIPTSSLGLLVRTQVAGDTGFAAIEEAVRQLDAAVPVSGLARMETVLADELALSRVASWLMSAFGFVSLGLSAIGLYGLLSHRVAQSTRDIGVRLALGAPRSEILSSIVMKGLALSAGGVAAGILGTLLLGRFLESALFEVSATDPVTIAASGILLLIVATVASYLPARRATRTDPVVALRQE